MVLPTTHPKQSAGAPARPPPLVRLHGGWRSATGEGETGRFAFWGEGEPAAAPPDAAAGAGRPRQYPRQVSLERLADVLTAMGLPGLSGRGSALPASKIVLSFPEVAGAPLPAVASPVIDGRRRPRRLTPCMVQVLAADLPSVVDALGAFPLVLPDDVELGPDLDFWAKACRVALHLLARQRFAPGIERRGNRFEARWTPVLDDPGDCEKIAACIDSMPPGCLAFAAPDGHPPGPGARPLFEDFLKATVDACVRHWLAVSPVEASIGNEGLQLGSLWKGLSRPDSVVGVSAAQGEQLAHAVESWMRPLSWSRTVTPVRTCLRLEEPFPPEGFAGAWAPAPGERCWTLRYLLQPLDDPSLLVGASEVWGSEEGPGLALLMQRTERPHEQLLSDLARVAKLSPPVDASLHGRAPAGAMLSTGEAFAFLSETSPVLEECGVGVMVPSWWKSPGARLGIRVRVKRKMEKGPTSGHFGLGQLAVFDWKVAMGDQPLTGEELAALSSAKSGLVYMRGMWVSVDPARLAATAARWKRQGEAGLLEVLRWSEGLDREASGLPVVGVDAEGPVAELLERLRRPEMLSGVPAPKGFSGALRPYQERGLAWLSFLRSFGLGACLADDMGLGKTIQLLASLQRQKEEGASGGPVLLICPTSVIGNWAREAARFTPSLRVAVHHGPERPHGKALKRAAGESDLFITSYPLVVRDHADLVDIGWSGLVLDEAQAVKNPGAKQAQACRKIQAGWRVAMTGTPVENRLRDLWSIFSILNPGYLGSLGEFQEDFASPVESDGDKAAAARLQALVRPFLLRRLKTDKTVAPDLPPKITTKETCALTKEQASLYQALVDRMLAELSDADEKVAVAADATARVRANFQRGSIVLNTLLRLKQVCNHPAQMLGDGSPLHGRSGKLTRLLELLEETVGAGDKALVFTQFAGFGQYLQPYLSERLGAEVIFLHGGTPRPAREEMIKRFQNQAGPPVFLLSLKAGGVGLNLTAASHVIHFDRWWNPAVEDQATDRAHRIGQKRTVQVHKLVTTGTLEDSIDALLEEKRELAASVIGAGEEWLTKLSTGQLRELLRLQHGAVED